MLPGAVPGATTGRNGIQEFHFSVVARPVDGGQKATKPCMIAGFSGEWAR